MFARLTFSRAIDHGLHEFSKPFHATENNMANQENQDGSNTKSIAFWLPIVAGMGAALGAGLGVAMGQVGILGIFVGFGVAVGMMLVGLIALALRRRS